MDTAQSDSLVVSWSLLPTSATLFAALLLLALLVYAVALASGFRIRRWLTGDASPRTLHSTLAIGLLLMTTLPMISLALIMADRSERAQRDLASDRLQATATGIAASLDQVIDKQLTGMVEVARNIERSGTMDPDALYEWVALHNSVYDDFLTMLVADADGRVIVAGKLEGDGVRRMPIAGHDVSDRSYFRVPKSTGEAYVSDAFRGRGLGTDPIVAVSAPFAMGDDTFSGIVEGSLNLSTFERFQTQFQLDAAELVLTDQAGRIVYSTTPETHPVLELLMPDDPLLAPAPADRTFDADADLVASTSSTQGWNVYLRLPVAPIAENVRRDYLTAWFWVAAAIVISSLLALVIARRVTRPLGRLRRTLESAELDDEITPIEPHADAPSEVALVFSHLNGMRDRLAAAYREVQDSLDAEAKAREALAAREKIIAQKSRELLRANEELERISRTDKLTGLANRRAFTESADVAWRTAARANTQVALIMVDLDYFKRYNDRYGHPAGDTCLRRVADVLRGAAGRALDVVARYGGEEFIIILTDSGLDAAVQVADRVRAGVAAMRMEHTASPFGIVTVSAGVASGLPAGDDRFDDVLEQADAALYAAKGAGRNFVSSLPDPADTAGQAS